jgi:hypothetical protein
MFRVVLGTTRPVLEITVGMLAKSEAPKRRGETVICITEIFVDAFSL